MEYGRQPPYQQDNSFYYHQQQQPPGGPGYVSQQGPSHDHHNSQSSSLPHLISIYNPSASERPSPPPTPVSAMPHMSSGYLPPIMGANRNDHMGMYDALPGPGPRSEDVASGSRRTASPLDGPSSQGGRTPTIKRVGGKANVSSACAPCKKAHLACDIMRPCKRCVNMGKEDMCEDVPHKKRGRPKVNKGPMGIPYQRARAHAEDMGGQYRQSLPPPFPPPGTHPYDPIYHPPPPPMYQSEYAKPNGQSHSILPPPATNRQPTPQQALSDPPDLFTMFTTTSLKVLRVTPGSSNLIGYHSDDFTGFSLLDWVHPADRHLLDGERLRLVGAVHSDASRDVPGLIQQRSERDLLSPAEGMKDQYPNQNVRIVRSDQQYSTFNVRLHLGGGLGGSLYRTETHDRLYLVVSCLLIPNQVNPTPVTALPPHTRAPSAATTASSYGPPTPITPMTVGPPGGLPSFSSIAAGVEAPLPQPISRYGGTPFSSRPSTGSQHASSNYYSRASAPVPALVPPVSLPPVTTQSGRAANHSSNGMYNKSPPSTYRSTNQTSYPPYDYPPNQNYYAEGDYRQGNHHTAANESEWRRHASEAQANPPGYQPSQANSAPNQSMQTPTSAIPIDYSRRPWET